MPPVSEQMALPGSRTNPDLIAARFLLKPGRKYEQAVKAFEPYDSIKEENPEARAAGRALIAEGKAAGPKRRTFIFVNNRLEGNALATIGAMLSPAETTGWSMTFRLSGGSFRVYMFPKEGGSISGLLPLQGEANGAF